MAERLKLDKFSFCIVINSFVYFLIAYYLVVFSFNLFSMTIASLLGFDVELFYYGFTWSGQEWRIEDTILVFFVGNLLTLVIAILFERLYSKQRKYAKGIKIFYLWVYLIAIIWFLGNVIVGAFFNFGIGAAIRAYKIPFFLRLILAMAAIYSLLFLGKKAQKHVQVMANLYFPKLLSRNVRNYFTQQIVLPIILGVLVIILLKIPYLGLYHYVDVYLLLTVVFFIAGLFYRHNSLDSMSFKSRDSDSDYLKRKACSISIFPIIILFLVLAIVRIGLMNGISF